jgi:hypothetical protein
MNRKPNQRICLHCNQLFTPAPQACNRQRFCGQPECRKASQVSSYKRWLAKNPDAYRGHVIRVQQWREENPAYGRRRRSKAEATAATANPAPPSGSPSQPPIPELLSLPNALHNPEIWNLLLIGFLAHVFGCALHNEISEIMHHLVCKGAAIQASALGPQMNDSEPKTHDKDKLPTSQSPSPGPAAAQSPGPTSPPS